jgi:hypothetical protein
VSESLDVTLIVRLREVLAGAPSTEAELRGLWEQADATARSLRGQIRSSERRLRRLSADPESSLTPIAAELRRLEGLRPELAELRSLLGRLEPRARELRTAWLLEQATAAQPGDHET